jgi:hypothetical protein
MNEKKCCGGHCHSENQDGENADLVSTEAITDITFTKRIVNALAPTSFKDQVVRNVKNILLLVLPGLTLAALLDKTSREAYIVASSGLLFNAAVNAVLGWASDYKQLGS